MHVVSAGATMKSVMPPGYKQTEVGVIPVDWIEHTIGELIEFEGGSQPDKSYFRTSWKHDYVRLIQIRDYKTDKYETYVPTHLARRFCSEHDIMIGRYGPPVFQILRGIAGAYNVALIKAKPGLGIDGSYAYYFLKQDKLFSFIEKLSQRSSGQTGVDLKELRLYPLPLPPTKAEQEAIAEALSDTDALIESLEQLITKKRHIKQGVMQELLTGKKRLSGFSGEWEVKRFEEIVRLRKERIDPRRSEAAEFCIELEHIEQGTGCLAGYTETGENSSLKSVFQKEDVLFGKLRAYLRKYWLANRDGVCSTEIWVLVAKHTLIIPKYLFQLVKVDSFVEAAITAYGTHMPRSDWTVVKNYEVPLPAIAEQTAIATILSDMDAEIDTLETKLAKTRQLKQGMMHNLLTGRIRLINPTIASLEHHASNGSERPAAPKLDKPHTWAFNEAVVISILADQFAKPEFPLGRKRYTKLSYLMHRMAEQAADGYLKKAAGPYNPKTKYAGPERIALENGYIREHQNGKFRGFVAAEKIEQAKAYFTKWYGVNIGAWLEQFRRRSNDDLERLATVDMAMQDLLRQGKVVDVASVRALIASEPEWLPKLERPVFSDTGIAAAIEECRTVFGC